MNTASASKPSSDLLHGFLCSDEQAVLAKIARYKAEGGQRLHLLTDFDLTLTQGFVPGQNSGTWDVIDELLPPDAVVRHAEIYGSLRPLELQGILTPDIAVEKWSAVLNLICSHNINIDDLRDAFLHVAQLRDGTLELFQYLAAAEVPRVVLSSGISNVINIMLDHYGILATHIVSNTLQYDQNSKKVTGWDPSTLIHILNKNERASGELRQLRTARPNTILLGDVPADVKMIDGEALRIRVLDPRKGETHVFDNAVAESFAAGYDLVTEHSLEPVARIARWIVEHA